ncbi:MAG: EAL domain-containing protein [Rhodocyclaceae bacterium]|nr:EAL domain-containing protein [Rhodocyclaceae bacterium]
MSTEEIYLARQPILDRRHRLVAYELLFRSGKEAAAGAIQDNLAATAHVIQHAFADLGLEAALGPHRGFLNCDEAMLVSDMVEILPREKIVLEILETVEPTPTIVERCRDLAAQGFTLALDDFTEVEKKWQPLLPSIAIVKVDLQPLTPEALAHVSRELMRWPVQLLAEKVDHREQAERCLSLGYSFFQGYYFARPTLLAGKKLAASQLVLMRLLTLVLEDADTAQIEAVFKEEPGLAMNLLRLVNSVALGLTIKVTSLRHALAVLGRRQLQRWLQILLYAGASQEGVTSPLLSMAALRGRFMELIAAEIGRDQEFADHAFMTGVLSLMPAVMNVPLPELLKGLRLPDDIVVALLDAEGDLGQLLLLTEALENGNALLCHDLVAKIPGLDAKTVNRCEAEALAWVGNIGQEV